jgi:hypothetical protein
LQELFVGGGITDWGCGSASWRTTAVLLLGRGSAAILLWRRASLRAAWIGGLLTLE